MRTKVHLSTLDGWTATCAHVPGGTVFDPALDMYVRFHEKVCTPTHRRNDTVMA